METYYLNKSTRELKGEVFKPYPLNVQYLASNFGRIKSKQQIVKHNYGGNAIKKERILTQTDNGSGYLSVGLTENGKTKNTRVSRIIAITFVENSENKPQVNHINGNKKDNRSVNLEWNTSGENVRHAWNNGLAKKQSSYIYIKERLEKINPYITNRVRCKTPIGYGTIIIDQNCYRIEYDNGKFENLVKSLRFWRDDFKLCLRNISDLTKPIEHNGETFIPMAEISNRNSFITYIRNQFVIGINPIYKLDELPTFVTYLLVKWHFDISGLIEKGEAIDVNTLPENPYK